tara:strand:- start:271 stop:423 length:153 start_codon:yes stop_codon:yes gene_type:complete
MIRIFKDGKEIYKNENIHQVAEEILFNDYDVKEIVVNINHEMVEKKYGRF